MPDGLPMDADRSNLLRLEAHLGQQCRNRCSASVHQCIGGERGPVQFIGPLSLQRSELGPQFWIEAHVCMRERAARCNIEIGDHAVDAVDARAGHESDVERGNQDSLLPLVGPSEHHIASKR